MSLQKLTGAQDTRVKRKQDRSRIRRGGGKKFGMGRGGGKKADQSHAVQARSSSLQPGEACDE